MGPAARFLLCQGDMKKNNSNRPNTTRDIKALSNDQLATTKGGFTRFREPGDKQISDQNP